jgi:type I restriction enzyme S subunit
MKNWVSIGSVCKINPKIPKELIENKKQKVSFLPMASIKEDGTIHYQEERTLSEVYRGYRYFQQGDIILSKITPCFENGKSALVEELPRKVGFGSTEFHVIRPNENVDPKFLFYQIRKGEFLFVGEKSMTGTAGQKRLPVNFLERYEIFLPPLEEQRKIGLILSKADAIRRKRQQAIQLADEFLRATFLDMFGDPVTNPKGWPQQLLGEVSSFIGGGSLPEGSRFLGQSNGILLLKVSDMNRFDNILFLESGSEWIENYRNKKSIVPPLSTIFPKRGGAISTNKKRMVLRPSLIDPNLMAVFPSNSLICPFFLFSWLLLLDLTRISNGSSVPQLNKKDLYPLRIYMPPTSEQERFKNIFLGIMKNKKRMENFLGFPFFESLAQRAFRGDL